MKIKKKYLGFTLGVFFFNREKNVFHRIKKTKKQKEQEQRSKKKTKIPKSKKKRGYFIKKTYKKSIKN